MITMYGIPNCDTIKKARAWLQKHGVDYRFHDYKKAGIADTTLRQWSRELSIDELINKRGTTWRKLDEAERRGVEENEDAAIALMMAKPSLIKRPVLDTGTKRILGFNEQHYESLL